MSPRVGSAPRDIARSGAGSNGSVESDSGSIAGAVKNASRLRHERVFV